MENNLKQYVFVSGPSESGKSGGVNYLKNNYDNVVHLKIRNVMPLVQKEYRSNIPYESWQDTVEPLNPQMFWTRYINKVNELSEGYNIVIMDTIYSIDSIKTLYEVLGDNLTLLYVNADFDKRVERELLRLRTDSIRGKRKANLSITYDEVLKQTMLKDEKKYSKGVDRLPALAFNSNYTKLIIDENGVQFPYVIQNNDSEDAFFRYLDEFYCKQKQLVYNRM